MKEIEFYHSVSRKGFSELANALGTITDQPVKIEGNAIVFPPSVATGRMEFYELNDGLGIGVADCTFHMKVKMKHLVVPGSDSYKVMYTIGDQPLNMTGLDGLGIQLGNNMAESVFFSSHSVASDVSIAEGQHVRVVILYFQQAWGIRYLLNNSMPLRVGRLMRFINHEQMQFTYGTDLKSRELLEDVLAVKASGRIMPRLLEGYACQLIALFCNNLVAQDIDEKQILSDDAIRMIQLKEQLAQNLEEAPMPLEKAAEMCLMSRTKFVVMFRTLFGKNYATYFLDLKMEHAQKMLEQGLPVMDVGYKIGYANISHFIKAFKGRYGMTPGAYQVSLAGAGKAAQ